MMADQQQSHSPLRVSAEPQKAFPNSTAPPPSYSAWRTSAHLYLPFVTVALFMTLGTPFGTIQANVLSVILSAIPTNWLASFFYPPDRPEPTAEQAVRFSRKKDIYRAAILYTYRWLFGRPFNVQFFLADFAMSYTISYFVVERPAGTKQRRSEFGVHLLWVVGNAILMHYAPSYLSYLATMADRMIWRAAYIALVDDVIGVLARPNLRTWKGKVILVLTQSLVITFSCWMLLRWRMQRILAYENDEEFLATLAALNHEQGSVGVETPIEDDGDRFLV